MRNNRSADHPQVKLDKVAIQMIHKNVTELFIKYWKKNCFQDQPWLLLLFRQEI